MPLSLFHPITARWFEDRFGASTEPQRLGWPAIARGENTLIAAPTGSGKTLTAFLVCIDRLLREALRGELKAECKVLYVSPLKALASDIRKNLEDPLREIQEYAAKAGHDIEPIRSFARTGDTPSHQRQAITKNPPHILVTTPESFYLMLTSEKGREVLKTVETVIVDEIHALARDKRGSHLSLSLERLKALTQRSPTLIGLSATQKPVEEIAAFLVGADTTSPERARRDCTIIDTGHARHLDMGMVVPASPLSTICSHEQWDEVYALLAEHIRNHRSTLVFVNTRRLSERVAYRLAEILGEDQVLCHHGSLSKARRLQAETLLKEGRLKAIVATASLELGIDIGYIDLVCQIGVPYSIAT
ncbi:DEAD/DEAH box helicase, partial [bacterium]|nr:DEAD/DEAH box helicase [bacterium]